MDSVGDLRFRLRRIGVVSAALMALPAAAAVALLSADRSVTTTFVAVLILALGGAAAVVLAGHNAARGAEIIHRQIDGVLDAARHQMNDIASRAQQMSNAVSRSQEQIEGLRALTARGQHEIERVATAVRVGERPVIARGQVAAPDGGSDPLTVLAYEIQAAQYAAQIAVIETADLADNGQPGRQVAVFVNLARRLLSIIHQALQRLDEVERQVEAPRLLEQVFGIDHLVTLVRRQAENIYVLGGATPRRQWTEPVGLYDVVRSAVAEIPQYRRVNLMPPISGALQGHAVADIVHLLAELAENATKFSDKTVTLRVDAVPAGLFIEIEDLGLPIDPEVLTRLNEQLTDPDLIDRDALYHDGRIGLYVVAVLARRHEVAVRLRRNMYGGTSAHVVIPSVLVGDEPERHQASEPERRDPVPAAAVDSGSAEILSVAGSSRSGSGVGPARPSNAQPQPVAVNQGQGAQVPPTGDPASPVGVGPGRPGLDRAPGPTSAPRSTSTPSTSANGHDRARQDRAGETDRPALPRRAPGTQLPPGQQRPGPGVRTEPPGSFTPTLMGDFRKGIRQAQVEQPGGMTESTESASEENRS